MSKLNQKKRSSEALGIVLKLSTLLEAKKIRMNRFERLFVFSLDLGKINTEQLDLLRRMKEKFTCLTTRSQNAH